VRAQFWAAHRSELLRAGLGVLAAIDTLIGGWALVLPGSFYRDFPGFGMRWVAAAPPYLLVVSPMLPVASTADLIRLASIMNLLNNAASTAIGAAGSRQLLDGIGIPAD